MVKSNLINFKLLRKSIEEGFLFGETKSSKMKNASVEKSSDALKLFNLFSQNYFAFFNSKVRAIRSV